MTKSNDEWVPEVGGECEWCGESGGYFVPASVVALSDDEIVLQNKTGQNYRPGQFEVFKHKYMRFRPLKTEAEKRRDFGVAEMKALFHKNVCLPNDEIFETIHDAGWIKPKPLTDEFISNIWGEVFPESYSSPPYLFAKAIEAYVRGEPDL